MLRRIVLALPYLAIVRAATGGQFCGTDLCVNAVVNGDSVTYQLVSQLGYDQLGWMAVGFGTRMQNSPIVLTWSNSDGTVTLSQREATAHIMPTVVANPTDQATFVAENSALSSNATTIAFSYPLPSTSLNAVPMIWAYSIQKPSSSAVDATIVQHDKMGTATMDLTQTVSDLSSATRATTTVVAGSTKTILPTATGSSPSSSSGGTPAGNASLSGPEKTIRTHGILMSLGFLVFLPLGIFIARFSRTISFLKARWFTAHWFVQLVVSAPIIIAGWVTAYNYVGVDHFQDTHTRVGLVLLILYFVQMALGTIIHFFKPKRKPLPPLEDWNRGEPKAPTPQGLTPESTEHSSSVARPTYPPSMPVPSSTVLVNEDGRLSEKKLASRDTMTPAITGRPIQNYTHALLGLTIIGLAMFNVHEGYGYEWPYVFGSSVDEVPFLRQIRAWWIASVVIIPIVYAAGLLLLPRQWRQETRARRTAGN